MSDELVSPKPEPFEHLQLTMTSFGRLIGLNLQLLQEELKCATLRMTLTAIGFAYGVASSLFWIQMLVLLAFCQIFGGVPIPHGPLLLLVSLAGLLMGVGVGWIAAYIFMKTPLVSQKSWRLLQQEFGFDM